MRVGRAELPRRRGPRLLRGGANRGARLGHHRRAADVASERRRAGRHRRGRRDGRRDRVLARLRHGLLLGDYLRHRALLGLPLERRGAGVSIALERRLFLTATPRKFKQQDVKAEARGESTVVSMDNTTEFGPVVYEMSHQQAVERGIVTPLKLLVYNVSHGYANLCERVPEVRVAWAAGVWAARRVRVGVHTSV